MKNRYMNKYGFINQKYLERIGFVEESRENYIFIIRGITIIYCNSNLYYSKKGDTKSTFFSNVNYKNIEDKLAEIIYLNN